MQQKFFFGNGEICRNIYKALKMYCTTVYLQPCVIFVTRIMVAFHKLADK